MPTFTFQKTCWSHPFPSTSFSRTFALSHLWGDVILRTFSHGMRPMSAKTPKNGPFKPTNILTCLRTRITISMAAISLGSSMLNLEDTWLLMTVRKTKVRWRLTLGFSLSPRAMIIQLITNCLKSKKYTTRWKKADRLSSGKKKKIQAIKVWASDWDISYLVDYSKSASTRTGSRSARYWHLPQASQANSRKMVKGSPPKRFLRKAIVSRTMFSS